MPNTVPAAAEGLSINRRALLAFGAASALVSAQEHASASGIPLAAEGAEMEAHMNMMVKPETVKAELSIDRLTRLAREMSHALDEWHQSKHPDSLWSATVWPTFSGRGFLMTDHSAYLEPEDPLLDAINGYRSAVHDYNTNAPADTDEADAYAEKTMVPAMDVIEAWDTPARSLRSAVEAIKLVLEEERSYQMSPMVEPLLTAALGFLEQPSA